MPGDKYDIQFRQADGSLGRFLKIQGGNNGVHLYPAGFVDPSPLIVARWNDQTIGDDLIAQFRWEDAYSPGLSNRLAYVSLHPEGLLFRLQLSGAPPIDIENDGELDRFIEFAIVSDCPELYRCKPRTEGGTVVDSSDGAFGMRGYFALAGGDLRNHPMIGTTVNEVFGGTEAVLFYVSDMGDRPKQLPKSRPRGTLLGLLFRLTSGLYTCKSFLLQ